MASGETQTMTIILVVFILIAMIASIVFVLLQYMSQPRDTSLREGENLGQNTASLFRVDEVRANEVYIRNMGSVPVSNGSLMVYIDNSPVSYSMQGNLSPGEVGAMAVSGLSGFALGKHTLKITGRGIGVEEEVILVKNTANSVLYLDFNEGSGNVSSDMSDYRNDVFCVSGQCPSWVPGINGSGLSFDPDENDYMLTSPWDGFPQAGQEVTYTAWIYTQDERANVIIVGFTQAQDTALMVSNGYLSLAITNASTSYYTNPVPIEKKKWYFVQGSYENTNVHVYVNDIGQHWYGISQIPGGSPDDSMIIGAYSPSQYFFHGVIDDVRVYNKYLPAYENVSMVLG